MNDHESADGAKWFESIVSWVADKLISHRTDVKNAARTHAVKFCGFRNDSSFGSYNLSVYQTLTADGAYLHGLLVCSTHGSTSSTYTLLGVQILQSCHYMHTSDSILSWPNVHCTQDAPHLGEISFTQEDNLISIMEGESSIKCIPPSCNCCMVLFI